MPNDLGDAVNANDKPFSSTFPFLGLPDSGSITKTVNAADHRHDHTLRVEWRVPVCSEHVEAGPVPRRSTGGLRPPGCQRKAHRMRTAAPARASRRVQPSASQGVVTVARRPGCSAAPRSATPRRPRSPDRAATGHRPRRARQRHRPDRHPAGPAADHPGTHRSWSTLGFAYVEQARITADPTYYPKADKALARAAALAPHDSVLLIARATLAAARHDFGQSLALTRRGGRRSTPTAPPRRRSAPTRSPSSVATAMPAGRRPAPTTCAPARRRSPGSPTQAELRGHLPVRAG